MSGFAGIVQADGGTPDAKLIERMADRLAFRGPDATQIWKRPGAGFCFTLLRTGPSPQSESQPLSLEGRIWLLGDVRLDGREELVRKIEQLDGKISVHVTNEELILRAWQLWGEKSFEVLTGDFALAIWDAEVKQLWCARSLMGARPFFYAQAGGQLIFSNTLEVVRDFSGPFQRNSISKFYGRFSFAVVVPRSRTHRVSRYSPSASGPRSQVFEPRTLRASLCDSSHRRTAISKEARRLCRRVSRPLGASGSRSIARGNRRVFL